MSFGDSIGRRLGTAVSGALVRAARGAVAATMAGDLRLESVDVSWEVIPDGYRLAVGYDIASDGPATSNPIGVDLTTSPLIFVNAACEEAASVDRPEPGAPGGRVIRFFPSRGKRWAHAHLQMTLDWHIGEARITDASPFFVMPEFLPPVFGVLYPESGGDQAMWRQARVTIRKELPRSLRLAYIDAGGGPADRTPFLQAAVWESSVSDEPESDYVAVGGSAAVGLEAADRQRVASDTERIIDFLGRHFGQPFAGKAVVILAHDKSQLPISYGGVLVSSPAWYGLTEGHSGPFEAGVVRNASRIWWGAGCRIAEPSAAYYYSAIAGAMALTWLRERGKVRELGQLAKVYMDDAGCDMRGRNPQSVEARSHRAALSLALFDSLKDRDGEAARAIQTLTRVSWGSVVRGRDVASGLREAGVTVPANVESW